MPPNGFGMADLDLVFFLIASAILASLSNRKPSTIDTARRERPNVSASPLSTTECRRPRESETHPRR